MHDDLRLRLRSAAEDIEVPQESLAEAIGRGRGVKRRRWAGGAAAMLILAAALAAAVPLLDGLRRGSQGTVAGGDALLQALLVTPFEQPVPADLEPMPPDMTGLGGRGQVGTVIVSFTSESQPPEHQGSPAHIYFTVFDDGEAALAHAIRRDSALVEGGQNDEVDVARLRNLEEIAEAHTCVTGPYGDVSCRLTLDRVGITITSRLAMMGITNNDHVEDLARAAVDHLERVQANEDDPPPSAWEPPPRYEFVLLSTCGERSGLGRFYIQVQDGEITAFAGRDDSARIHLREFGSGDLPTLEDLLEEASRAEARGADEVRRIFDEDDGHLLRIEIDWDEMATDDEACYAVTDYSELQPAQNDDVVPDCSVLCISDGTLLEGQTVEITFAPPKDHIWGVTTELRFVEDGRSRRVAWLEASRPRGRLRTVWPGPNVGFIRLGMSGRARWRWQVEDLPVGTYELAKEYSRQGGEPVDQRTQEATVRFEVVG